VALSAADKQRRYRERKRKQADEQRRRERGLPPAPTQDDAPQGAFLTRAGKPRARVGWYARVDGTGFAPIPPAIVNATFTHSSGEQRPFSDGQRKMRARAAEEPRLTPEQELAPLVEGAPAELPLRDDTAGSSFTIPMRPPARVETPDEQWQREDADAAREDARVRARLT
jgi:hypothetical protein